VKRFALTLNATPPLSLAYLAGSLAAAGHLVQVIDAVGEAPAATWPTPWPGVLGNGLGLAAITDLVDRRTEVIGVSCLFSHEWPLTRSLLRLLGRRFPRVPLVCGGEHVTAVPEACLADAPELAACVLGEGEATAVELVAALAGGGPLALVDGIAYRDGGRVMRTRPRVRIEDVDALPPPRWDLTPLESYLRAGLSFGVDRGRTLPVLASRGCPYACTFCSSPTMWTRRHRQRDPRAVVDEIARAVRELGVEAIDFYDLTPFLERQWIVAFCEELIGRRLPVSWQLPSGTRAEPIDGEVARLLVRSGCRNLSLAPESGSRRVLGRAAKQVDPERIVAAAAAAVAAGLNVKVNLLIGLPGEEGADVRDTMRLLLRLARVGVHDASVWTVVPYPGSRIFADLRAGGAIPELDDHYYLALLSYADAAGAVSWDRSTSAARLEAYRLAGLLLFYARSFARDPRRPVAMARHLLHGRYESRGEMSLANLARRLGRSLAQRGESPDPGVRG
jgi:radical SAM superfamily enzyme YgiQ (UPF0313 family)